MLNRRWLGKRKLRNIESVHFAECGMSPTGLRHYKRFDLIEPSGNVHGSLRSLYFPVASRICCPTCAMHVTSESVDRSRLRFNEQSIRFKPSMAVSVPKLFKSGSRINPSLWFFLTDAFCDYNVALQCIFSMIYLWREKWSFSVGLSFSVYINCL